MEIGIDMNNATASAFAAMILEELIAMAEEEIEDNGRNGELNDVVSNTTLANVYVVFFDQTLRKREFIKIFELCFGGDSYICSKHPQPIMCKDCLSKYIKTSETLIECTMNEEVRKTYKDIILPRLVELRDLVIMLNESSMMGATMDGIMHMMGIDSTPYDPPSESILEKCEKFDYIKGENDDACTICLCDLEEGDYVHKLVCGHIFHDECLNGWIKNNSTCPNCKFSLK